VSWFRSSRRRGSGAAAAEAAAEPERPPVEPERRPRAELEPLHLAELHALARDAGLPRYRLLRRGELVDALAGGAPQAGASPAGMSGRPEVRVEQVRKVSSEIAAAIGALVSQLSRSASAPTEEELRWVVESRATSLLVGRDAQNAVVGTLTLVVFRTPTGARARVEDVVVDETSRGRGVGEALVVEALRLAREHGARTVDLTSSPQRAAANGLYEKLGFGRRDTNVYRIET
jgi:ribosomal protein S18 acetylase RimI-like enzyme